MTNSKYVAVTAEDLARVQACTLSTPLALYLYSGIRSLTDYKDGYVGTWDGFCRYFNLREQDSDEIEQTLQALIDEEYIACSNIKDDKIFVYATNYKRSGFDSAPMMNFQFSPKAQEILRRAT